MSTTPPDTQHQPPGPGPDTGPRVSWDDVRDLGRIRRVRTDRRIAGVAGGLARHLDIDPLIVRVAFVVLAFFGGTGLLLYVALWLLLPEDGSDWAKVALDRRSRVVALVLVGLLALMILVGHSWWGAGYPWALLVVAGLVALVASQLPSRDGRDRGDRGHRGDQDLGQASPEAPGAVPPVAPPPDQPSTLAEAPAVEPGPPAYPPYVPPAYGAPVPQPRPTNPRKKGPILFWFTLAVMAVAVGALAVADLAGARVAPSAYPALVLALSGVALLVGAFWGRAGGLILVGLLAWPVMAVSTAVDKWDVHRTVDRPLSSAEVRSSYRMDNGELVVDLSQVADPRGLDGRTVHVSGDVGHLDIRVPYGVNVIAHLDVNGAGGISAFGSNEGGFDHQLDTRHVVRPGAPTLTVDARLDVGAIDLHTEATR